MEDTAAQDSVIPREVPKPEPGRAELISLWQKRIEAAKKHFKDDFEAMRADMEFARLGADKTWAKAGKYVANLALRVASRKVADLYARNPRAVARRAERVEHQIWDGTPESLMMAQQALTMGVMDPAAMAVVQEVQEVKLRRAMLDRVGKTLEIMFHYYLNEQEPSFKIQAKQLVRRVVTCGVGYVELGVMRTMEPRPEVEAQLNDVARQLAEIEAITADLADGEIQQDTARAEELRVTLEALQAQAEVITHEGLLFMFPRATEIIVDPKCRQLKGFIGADWIAGEMMMHPDRVKALYKIDLGKSVTRYQPDNPALRVSNANHEAAEAEAGLVRLYKVQDKLTGSMFTIAEGHPDYILPPAPPDIQLERFFSVFSLTFNDIEDDCKLYPPSDIRLMMDPQLEHNRARQGLREHRVANRPKYLTARGQLEETDKKALQSTEAHVVIELNALQPGQPADSLLQALKMHGIDPAMYDTTPAIDDIMRTTGAQDANLGGLQGTTATESSIAEQSRVSSIASNVDDLDDLLTELARAAGQAMLQHLGPDQVKQIAGPGAIWPEWTSAEIANEIYLTVRAGSAGRPNRAQELANIERVGPLIVQVPGVNPTWFARKLLERMDDSDLDLEEAIAEGMPSMIAMNSMAGGASGPAPGSPGQGEGPDSDPNAQSGQGAQNAPRPDRNEPGPQPAFPAMGGMVA